MRRSLLTLLLHRLPARHWSIAEISMHYQVAGVIAMRSGYRIRLIVTDYRLPAGLTRVRYGYVETNRAGRVTIVSPALGGQFSRRMCIDGLPDAARRYASRPAEA
jgi:hypothetical protein